jgi:hypothetical protein
MDRPTVRILQTSGTANVRDSPYFMGQPMFPGSDHVFPCQLGQTRCPNINWVGPGALTLAGSDQELRILVGLEDTGTLVNIPRYSIQSGRSTAKKKQCALDSGDALWSEHVGAGG